jgi:hypothetical protein
MDQTLILASGKQQITVLTGETTRVLIPGMEAPELDDLHVGDPVAVAGIEDQADRLRGLIIRVLPSEDLLLVRGNVQSINDDSFRLDTPRGEMTIIVDDKTRFRLPGINDPGIRDLTQGDRVFVAGMKNEDESLQALRVARIAMRPQRGLIIGRAR